MPAQVPNPSLCTGTPQVPGPPQGTWRKPAGTLLAKVVHQDDLLQVGPGRCVQDAMHGSQEGGPGLIVETEDDAGCGQAVSGTLLQTPAGKRSRALRGRAGPGWGFFSQWLSSQLTGSLWVFSEFPRKENPLHPDRSAVHYLPGLGFRELLYNVNPRLSRSS